MDLSRSHWLVATSALQLLTCFVPQLACSILLVLCCGITSCLRRFAVADRSSFQNSAQSLPSKWKTKKKKLSQDASETDEVVLFTFSSREAQEVVVREPGRHGGECLANLRIICYLVCSAGTWEEGKFRLKKKKIQRMTKEMWRSEVMERFEGKYSLSILFVLFLWLITQKIFCQGCLVNSCLDSGC